ncbi:MAG: outer membrane protein assembly factor BamD, partial [Candidatus Dadabacteria bacterium]|nr:outer membrane protein assembly factor BamD [Candidatus Dadabacteria bacterium]
QEKNPEENYYLGLKEFTDGNYGPARDLLKKYLAEKPESDKAQNAMFLIADSYFIEGLYEESILEYQNMIESWPASPKIPLCQLKQGIALMKIGKPNDASLFFESLIETYPESPEAQTAKKHLNTLSRPSE